MSQTLDYYNEVLPAFGAQADAEGYINTLTPTGTKIPSTIEGKRVVLPTPTFLKNGFGEEFQPFHPVSESLSRAGTSPIIRYLQRSAKAMISYRVVTLARGLLELAVDKSSHKDLHPSATEFLKKLANVDKNTTAVFDKLIAAAGKENRFVTVYLKNGGSFEGKKVNRMAIIRFPIIEDLQSDSKTVLGIDIPKKQRAVITTLLKIVVPFGDSPDEYVHGTSSRVAPYFVALLHAYHKIISTLNQVSNRYKQELCIEPIPLFDIKVTEKFGEFYSEIPALNGNRGANDESEEENLSVDKKEATKKTLSPQPVRKAQVATPVTPTVTKPTVQDMLNAMNPTYNQPQQIQPQFVQQPQFSPQQQFIGQQSVVSSPFAAAFPQQQLQMNNLGFQQNQGLTLEQQFQLKMGLQPQQLQQQQYSPFAQAFSPMANNQSLGLI